MLIADKEEEGGEPNVYNAEQPRQPFQARKWFSSSFQKSSHQLESPGQVEVLCKLEGSWINQVITSHYALLEY